VSHPLSLLPPSSLLFSHPTPLHQQPAGLIEITTAPNTGSGTSGSISLNTGNTATAATSGSITMATGVASSGSAGMLFGFLDVLLLFSYSNIWVFCCCFDGLFCWYVIRISVVFLLAF
jgi:hypothetical protein